MRSLGKQVVGNVMVTAAARYGDREAFYCSSTGRRLSFNEINTRTNRLANALLSLGLKKGDTVAFLCTNRVETVEIFFALAKTGLLGVPLNYRLSATEIAELMVSMGAIGLIYDGCFAQTVEQIKPELPDNAYWIGIDDHSPLPSHDYEVFVQQGSAEEPDVEIAEEDPYYYNLTSGTTGIPKAYLLTQYNNATVIPFFNAMDLSSKDTVLTVFPMFGRVGFAWILGTLAVGARNVLHSFDVNKVPELIDVENVTMINLVPTMAHMLLNGPGLEKHNLSSLRGLVFAGSPLPASVREATQTRICPNLYEFYGMQETGVLVLSTPNDKTSKPESVGKPILFAEVRIVDADGNTMPHGEIGEIVGRTPTTVFEYYQSPEKSAETFRNGWLHTGDLGKFDAEGYLYVCGRIKDMIISGGQNVHSSEVEETIISCPGVADCTVIGLPDDCWGERVAALVITDAGHNLSGDSIMAYCRERLAGFKIPKQVIFTDEPFPLTATGKVTKYVLVKKYSR